MKTKLVLIGLLLLTPIAKGSVRVFVQDANGLANINYQCTAGEVVRAFALDVTVDQGQILGITNFFRGPSTATAQGYGIFPASFRDNVTVLSGTNADWSSSAYSPVAMPSDNPAGTLPGLNSSGVTLELGALWDPSVPSAVPASSGTLCTLRLSQAANVRIAANLARGGIIATPPDIPVSSQFAAGLVGPAILNTTINNGSVTVLFQDGELEAAPAVDGPWAGTGNYTGNYTEPLNAGPARFYRVHLH